MTEQIALGVPNWTLGDRLRKAREFAGLEQGELAARMGISRGTISNYELGRGIRPPKRYVIREWAQACGVPFDWLVEGTPFAVDALPDIPQAPGGVNHHFADHQLVA